jgi:hypothetical protein
MSQSKILALGNQFNIGTLYNYVEDVIVQGKYNSWIMYQNDRFVIVDVVHFFEYEQA